MHVMFLCFTDEPFDSPGDGGHGGSHIFVLDIGRYLKCRGFEVTYITRLNHPEKPLVQELGNKVRIYRLPIGPPEDIPYYQCGIFLEDFYNESVKIIEKLESPIDVIQSYNWISGEIGRQLSEKLSIKHIHCVLALGRSRLAHGEDNSKVNKFWLECELKVFVSTDCLVTFCPNEAREIKEFYIEVNPDKIVVIPYAIDTKKFSRRPANTYNSFCRAAARFTEGIDNSY